jgi:hypothetical protein
MVKGLKRLKQKDPQTPGLMGGQAQTASAIQSAGGGPEAIIIYDKSSSPSADDYIIDVDHSTMRLSTGYPVETHL